MTELKRESRPQEGANDGSMENGLYPIETSGGSEDRLSSVVAIIPAYNESGTIAEVIQQTAQYVDKVLVINDASTDNTEEVAREHADGVVSHPKNMGVGGAVDTGYLAAIREGYDIVIQIDGDGQHDPSYIPGLIDKLTETDADMVIGSRWRNESHKEYSLVRRAGIQFFTMETNVIADTKITDVTSGYRAYRTSMLENLGRPAKSHWALEQTIEAARKGYQIEEISVPMEPETEGSQFDIGTLLKYPPRMVLTTFKVLLYR
jgi:glycosyltransferase involved in cell wall biosynthesis